MKKVFLFSAALLFSIHLFAQTEIKISPIPLLFGYGAIGIEHGISESFGIDGDLYYIDDFFAATLSGKYYFNPEMGLDKFHIGMFLGAFEGVGVGFLAGTKLVSRKNVLFEIGLGAGRSFEGGGVGYAKLHIGYRFNKKAKLVAK